MNLSKLLYPGDSNFLGAGRELFILSFSSLDVMGSQFVLRELGTSSEFLNEKKASFQGDGSSMTCLATFLFGVQENK